MGAIYALAMIALAVAIGVPVGIAQSKRSGRDGKKETRTESVYFDLSDEAALPAEQDIVAALDARTTVWHVGKIARATITQLEEAAAAKELLQQTIDARFEPGSLTNDKFTAPVDAAYKALVRNSAELSNRVQDFDGREFSRMRKLMSGGDYQQDDVPDAIQEARWATLSGDYETIRTIANANRLILAELAKLEKELQRLSETDAATASEQLAADLDELTSHVKYYKS